MDLHHVLRFSVPLPSENPQPIPFVFDPLPYAVRDIDMACATIMDEILSAKTIDDCERIRRVASECSLKLAAMESSALDRATRLTGGRREPQ
jgi:hypothetical protein